MAEAPDPKSNRQWALAYSVGSTLVGPMFLGLLIDLAVGTMPWLTVVGVFLGMMGAFVTLIKMTKPKA
jgi:F0F1-type ATP synthase assembly protein I